MNGKSKSFTKYFLALDKICKNMLRCPYGKIIRMSKIIWRNNMLFNSYVFIFLFLPLVLAGWYFLNYLKAHEAAKFFWPVCLFGFTDTLTNIILQLSL